MSSSDVAAGPAFSGTISSDSMSAAGTLMTDATIRWPAAPDTAVCMMVA